MSDPLVAALREAANHVWYTWLDEKWPCRLLERAADALESTAVREQRLRAALEQIATQQRYTFDGDPAPETRYEQPEGIARRALAAAHAE